VLEAINLDCVRGERRLFHNLSFQLKAGECLLVRGENGSGKTSLLRMLVGLTPPAAGAVYSPLATSNSPTFGRSNSPRQDGQIINHRCCCAQGARRPL